MAFRRGQFRGLRERKEAVTDSPSSDATRPYPRVAIRDERADDAEAVWRINEAAFGQPDEARLVRLLRDSAAVTLSLVAVLDGTVVGHILYSPVTLRSGAAVLAGAGLAPMCVAPGYQRRGIGTHLVTAGNARLRAAGQPFIVVLGHPDFYPRFGFEPASRHSITCQWDGVPDDVFMLLVLDRARLAGFSGVARYRDEFLAAT